MEFVWELVFIGSAAGLIWAWHRMGQTGIIRCRGSIMFVRQRQPFGFALTRSFVLVLGLTMFSVIPFFSGVRAIFTSVRTG
jgi:hypothetical protein